MSRILCMVALFGVGFAGYASPSVPSVPSAETKQAAEAAENWQKILRLYEEMRIPVGTPRAEVERRLPVEGYQPSSCAELGTIPENREDRIYEVSVQESGFKNEYRFMAKFWVVYVDGKVSDFALRMPEAYPREWLFWAGRVEKTGDHPLTVPRELLFQMEALRRKLDRLRQTGVTERDAGLR